MKRLICFFALIMMMFCVTPVMATPVVVGEPQIIGSWAQQFNETGVGNFDKLEAFMFIDPPFVFEAPGFFGFSSGGWSGDLVNPSYIKATGPDTTNMNFNIAFLQNSDAPALFDFLVWNGNSLLEWDYAFWNGSVWNIGPRNGVYVDGNFNRTPSATPTPIPAAVWLFGTGIIGLVGIRKRTKLT